MVSLPPAKQTSIGDDEPNVLTAYNTILDFERNAKTNKDALHARILGYLILHAPSTHARHEMARVTDLCGPQALPGENDLNCTSSQGI